MRQHINMIQKYSFHSYSLTLNYITKYDAR